MTMLRAAIGVLTLLALSPDTFAQDAKQFQISTHAGYRIGGEFEDRISGRELSLSDDQSYGFSIESIAGASGVKYGLLYSVQETQLDVRGFAASIPISKLDIEYIHIRGKRQLQSNPAVYSVGSMGITRFDPDASSYSTESRFSLGAGVGYEVPLNPSFSFQIEGRGFATFLDTNGALFCNSGGSCSLSVAGSVMLQFEAAAALVFRF